jgi:hypothetical protein
MSSIRKSGTPGTDFRDLLFFADDFDILVGKIVEFPSQNGQSVK